MSSEWPLWEVFIRGQHGLSHRHVGSLHAPDAEMAIKHARDVYTRRNEGVSIWAVKSNDIVGVEPFGQGAAVRAVELESLSSPDLLRNSRRSGTHVMGASTSAAERAALHEFLLRTGDNCLILGHRLSEWCGHAPVLEEDIALTNTALDLIGQTQLWLGLAGEVEGEGRTADDLAYLRDASGFRNVLLVERPNGDFGRTLMRQFLFDAWHLQLLKALQSSIRCAHRRDRRQGAEGGLLSPRTFGGSRRPARRRHGR